MILNIPDSQNPVAIDAAHNALISALVMCHKPHLVLELGIGSGATTQSILQSLAFNQYGRLASVDNLQDFGASNIPAWIDALTSEYFPLFSFILSSEKDAVNAWPPDDIDFLVSDADHTHSGEWLDRHLRIVKNGGILVFHDTNEPAYPSLYTIRERTKHLPQLHFTKSTRADERCNRGLLVLENRK